MTQQVIFGLLSIVMLGLLVHASWTDVHRMIIRNTTVLAMLVVSVLKGVMVAAPLGWYAAPQGFFQALWPDVMSAVLVFLVLFVLWLLRGMGPGDVKMAGACALWAGSAYVLDFVFAFAVLGGLAAVFFMGIRMVPFLREPIFQRLPWFREGGQLRFPYGPAIALGCLWAMMLQAKALMG